MRMGPRDETMRDAFDATMKDPDFVEEAHRLKLEVDARDGTYLQKLVGSIYATPKSIVDKIGKLIQ